MQYIILILSTMLVGFYSREGAYRVNYIIISCVYFKCLIKIINGQLYHIVTRLCVQINTSNDSDGN